VITTAGWFSTALASISSAVAGVCSARPAPTEDRTAGELPALLPPSRKLGATNENLRRGDAPAPKLSH
jgi:hypothetical protein